MTSTLSPTRYSEELWIPEPAADQAVRPAGLRKQWSLGNRVARGTRTLATALGLTAALEFSGLESSVAQPGARFQDQGIREDLGYPASGGLRYRHRHLGHDRHLSRGYALRLPTATRSSQVRTDSKRQNPRPDQSLLERQPPPDCAFKRPVSNPPTDEETRVKLDYEQQCYRQSEMIVRARLQQLQNSIEETSPDQPPLAAQMSPPDCAFKSSLREPPTAEEIRMKLDYEQQCYRQSETIVRTRLQLLQNSVEEASKPASRRNLQGKTP